MSDECWFAPTFSTIAPIVTKGCDVEGTIDLEIFAVPGTTSSSMNVARLGRNETMSFAIFVYVKLISLRIPTLLATRFTRLFTFGTEHTER